jgi:uncharacterized protein with PIN domain
MKFLADRTVGKLTKKLRLLGWDVVYWRGGKLTEAAETARAEERVLLTRSRRIRGEEGGLRVLVIEANDPKEQTREVLAKLGLKPAPETFFSRCLLCNEELRSVAKEEVQGRVPDFIYRQYDSFCTCPRCHRIYWPGSHLERMRKGFAQTLADLEIPREGPAKERRRTSDDSA